MCVCVCVFNHHLSFNIFIYECMNIFLIQHCFSWTPLDVMFLFSLFLFSFLTYLKVIDPLLQNASGKERTGMYMNPSLIIYLMRKWMPLKQEKIGIFGDIHVDFKAPLVD